MTRAQFLNQIYAIARKKTALNHQEQMTIRSAAAMLEQSFKLILEQKQRIEQLEKGADK